MDDSRPREATPEVPLRRPDGTPLVSPSTIRAALAIADGVFSRDGRGPPPDRMTWLERELEDYLARAGGTARLMLSCMIWLVTLVAPLLLGRAALLGSLSTVDKVRALTKLEERFGEPLLAVKAMLCLMYYEHPEAAREVGFDGNCLVPRTTGGTGGSS